MSQCCVYGCTKIAVHKNMCNAHYRRNLKYGDPTLGGHYKLYKNDSICRVEDCKHQAKSLGLCVKHYTRLIRHNDIEYSGNKKRQSIVHSKEYKSLDAAKQRCFNQNCKNYKLYGARGITVDSSWLGPSGFDNFYKELGDCPKGYTLDRIDVNGNYEPGNCRWADPRTQACNKRTNLKTPGVYSRKTTVGKWTAHITFHGKRISKTFDKLEDAIRQRKEWEEKYKY